MVLACCRSAASACSHSSVGGISLSAAVDLRLVLAAGLAGAFSCGGLSDADACRVGGVFGVAGFCTIAVVAVALRAADVFAKVFCVEVLDAAGFFAVVGVGEALGPADFFDEAFVAEALGCADWFDGAFVAEALVGEDFFVEAFVSEASGVSDFFAVTGLVARRLGPASVAAVFFDAALAAAPGPETGFAGAAFAVAAGLLLSAAAALAAAAVLR